MKILIYGAGYYGESILDTVKKYPKIEIAGFVDTYKKGEMQGYPIMSVNEAYRQNVSNPVIITVANMLHLKKIYNTLREQGFEKIYYYLHKSYCASNDFFQGECVEMTGSFENVLMSAELHLVDYCNLNCRGCAHYSPIFEKIVPDKKKRLADIETIAKLFDKVFVFNLMGGEPLLNPELEEYIIESRRLLPQSQLVLVTNGLLIPKLDEKILQCIAENKVTVAISEYRPTHKIIDEILERLEQYGIDYSVRKYDVKQKFCKPLSLSENSKYPRTCISPGCVNICDGKIARCPQLMYVPKLNEKFGLNLPEEGILELSCQTDGRLLLGKLEETIPLCKHCIECEIEWESCGANPDKYDFVEEE